MTKDLFFVYSYILEIRNTMSVDQNNLDIRRIALYPKITNFMDWNLSKLLVCIPDH